MDPYRKLLLEVSKELKSDEVEDFIFLIATKFGDGVTEGIKRPIKLFEMLINAGDISEYDNRLLIELLENIKRVDLIKKYFDESAGTFKALASVVTETKIYENAPPGAEFFPTTQQQEFRPATPSYSSIASSAGGEDRGFVNGTTAALDEDESVGSSSLASSSLDTSPPAPTHQLHELKTVDYEGAAPGPVSSDGCLAPASRPILGSQIFAEGQKAAEDETSKFRGADETIPEYIQSGIVSPTHHLVRPKRAQPVSSDGCLAPASRPMPSSLILGEGQKSAADDETRFLGNDRPTDGTISEDIQPGFGAGVSSADQNGVDADPNAVFRQLPIHAANGKVVHSKILARLSFNVELRSYQLSLAEPGLKGENSIVVLQTGGGKTHIAAYVTKYHSERAAVEGKRFRCLFLVPIRHLAEQQENVYKDAFGSQECAIVRKNREFVESFEKKNVIFCTAQILVNVLDNESKYGINMRHFSMIVVDECHHTVGSHPNNNVMQHYMRAKFESAEVLDSELPTYRIGESHLPLILGLSASLGAGEKKKDGGVLGQQKFIQEAVKHLKLVCSNMDSSTVLFPRDEDLVSLQRACPTVANENLIAVERRDDDEFHAALAAFVEKVMNLVEGSEFNYAEMELGNLALNSSIDKIIADKLTSDDQYTLAKYMKEFNKAFALLKILRAVDVLDYISVAEELPFRVVNRHADLSNIDFIRATQNLWLNHLENLREKAAEADRRSNPILQKLKEILMETFRDPDARGIILVEMRYSTKAIIEFIRSDSDLNDRVRPITLVGQTEMSDAVVKENLTGFRGGTDNLLVATDIAQEGLDIPQCNFVIRYHFVSNEVGAIQAVGRARMESSRCYLVVVKGSEEQKRHERVRKFIKAMDSALTHHLVFVEDGKWKRDVETHQEKVHDTRKRKLAGRRGKPKSPPTNFVVVCASCKTEITGAYNVIKIKETNHHLVDDDDIENKIHRVDDAVLNDTDVFCAKCKVNKLGIEVNYQKGCFYRGSWVALSAEGVKYKDVTKEDGRAAPPFKFAWKNAPFEVKVDSYSVDINDYDIEEE